MQTSIEETHAKHSRPTIINCSLNKSSYIYHVYASVSCHVAFHITQFGSINSMINRRENENTEPQNEKSRYTHSYTNYRWSQLASPPGDRSYWSPTPIRPPSRTIESRRRPPCYSRMTMDAEMPGIPAEGNVPLPLCTAGVRRGGGDHAVSVLYIEVSASQLFLFCLK